LTANAWKSWRKKTMIERNWINLIRVNPHLICLWLLEFLFRNSLRMSEDRCF
jgi:hypothetical protein